MPEMREGTRPQARCFGPAAGGALLHLLEQFGELRARHLFAEGLDLDFAARRGPAAAGRADLGHAARALRECRAARPASSASSTMRQPLYSLRVRIAPASVCALFRREDAGLLELVALLEGFHRGDRAVAEFRIEAANEIAGPDQVGLDGEPLGHRHRGIGVAFWAGVGGCGARPAARPLSRPWRRPSCAALASRRPAWRGLAAGCCAGGLAACAGCRPANQDASSAHRKMRSQYREHACAFALESRQNCPHIMMTAQFAIAQGPWQQCN